MIAATRSLRQAIDTLSELVARSRGRDVDPSDISVPVEEAFLSWAGLRTQLQAAGMQADIIKRLDGSFTNLVRLTTDSATKRSYRVQLNSARAVLVGELHDFAVRAALLRTPLTTAANSPLIPEISDLPNDFVPRPLLGWLPQMRTFLKTSPFENNVFVMVSYKKKLKSLITAAGKTIQDRGLNPVIARDNELTDDLYNPIANLVCCKYGIAVFDKGETGQKHNANVVYELAVMQTLKRPCVILKHHQVASMPSDFLHKLYQTYHTTREAIVRIGEWLETVKPEVDQ